jgi:DNA-directed RNA polymerase specialized sigma24 family protein
VTSGTARHCRGSSASHATCCANPCDATGSRRGHGLDLAAEDGYTDADDRLSPRRALAAALKQLPSHELRALELRVVDELPYGEVAERLEIRPAAARLRVSRALRRLAFTTPKEEL